jgi:hypothetical protein
MIVMGSVVNKMGFTHIDVILNPVGRIDMILMFVMAVVYAMSMKSYTLCAKQRQGEQ